MSAAVQSIPSVVVADANRDTADTVVQFLSLHDIGATAAYDGDDVIEKALTLKPRVVISSIALAKKDGYQVAAYLRRFTCLRSTYLIAHTGFARDVDITRALAAGFDRHFTKPADLDELLATLKQLGVRPQPSTTFPLSVARHLPCGRSPTQLCLCAAVQPHVG
ncbi:MAG: response regulator [Planctomycetes bacterium]|nr:response regulator [Planctomycetota bacterium]